MKTDIFLELKSLLMDLDHCLGRDRHRLRRAIERLKKESPPADLDQELASLKAKIEASKHLVCRRRSLVPLLQYPELPVSERREQILEAIQSHQVVIVCGETGSGKTTQLPKICLEAGRGVHGLIGHTQPRRIAARTVANRIAEELGSVLGNLVGYKVRFRDKTSPESLVKLMTDGILLAEIQNDRFLQDYDTLIIDEAHERSLNIDFLLGYLKWLLPRRPDLKLIVTSATIDPDRFSRHFGDAPVLMVSGRGYPVEIRYRPVEVEDGDETDNREQKAILEAVDELWRTQSGDILVFLSGEREIRETSESLRKHHPPTCEILPLYSRLSESEQEKVFKSTNRRRIVLATNVAETSLTVPGIRSVIDTGYARISRYSHRSKLQRLPIERISRASANQRSGRCGRLGPGVAVRLYSEQDFYSRDEFTDPEIARTHLAAVILQMQALGLGDVQRFPFVDPPDERLVRDGLRMLQELNAADENGRITEIGRRLSRLPIDPRLGRMLIAAHAEGCIHEVAIIVSALSVPDPRERPPEKSQLADQQHAHFKDERSDFLSFLKLWNAYEDQRSTGTKANLRAFCRQFFLSFVRMREWQDIHAQIMEVIKGEFAWRPNQEPQGYGEVHRALLSGLLGHVCVRGEQGEYQGARGTKLHIHPGSFLFKSRPKWIISAEQVETSKVYARVVAAIEPEWVEAVGAHMVRQQHYDPVWEQKSARVSVHERTQLLGLTVQAGRRIPFERVNPEEARELFIRHALVQMEYDSHAPFFQENRKLLEDAQYLQQKGRRVDLVVDDAWLFAFYDQRIPADVCNGVTFERWRKSAEKSHPDLLRLTPEKITSRVAENLDDTHFPDHFQLGSLRLPLQYQFDPGHEDDGVSALIPLQLLNTLEEAPFRWLVPGMLHQRINSILKSLPKTYRIHFVPIPEYVDRILPMLDFGKGDLFEQISLALKKTGGIQVPVSAFREALVPDHLKMNFLVLGEGQVVLDRGRDLKELKLRHGADAGSSFRQIASEACLVSGLKDWSFGDLQEYFEGEVDGQRVFGYPALHDEGGSVAYRIFETPLEASLAHEIGLARLLALSLGKELKYFTKNLGVDAQAELAYGRLGAHPYLYPELGVGRILREDLLLRMLASTFLEGLPIIRSREAFELRVSERKKDLPEMSLRMGPVLQNVMVSLVEIERKLQKIRAPAMIEDVRGQLGLMIYSGFLIRTPWSQIREFPRYLAAVAYRIEKASHDSGRDARQQAEIRLFQDAFWDPLRKASAFRVPERESFRWSLEEFRVSLFAQQLKTAYPVSAKRMQEGLRALSNS